MREKLETLSLVQLRQIAKDLEIRGFSSKKKAELVEAILEVDASRKQEESKELRKEKEPETEAPAPSRAANDAPQSASKSASQSAAQSAPQKASLSAPQNEPVVSQKDQQMQERSEQQSQRSEQQSQRSEQQSQRAEQPQQRSDQTQRGQQRRLMYRQEQRYNNNYNNNNNNRQNDNRQNDNRQNDNRQNDNRQNDNRQSDNRQNDNRQQRNEGRTRRFDYSAAAAAAAENQERGETPSDPNSNAPKLNSEQMQALDSGIPAHGILEVTESGFGFIRSDNYLTGDQDVYVAPSQIHKFNLKTGDFITGSKRIKTPTEKFAALLYIQKINDEPVDRAIRRPDFNQLTPIFPNKRIHLERPGGSVSTRIVDLLSPVGKGQRGMIASQPKAGKTTLLKEVAMSVLKNHPEMHVIILLIDERPEEVTDFKEFVKDTNAEVIHSTFDETPAHHVQVSEMVLERAKRLVEHGRDVMILLDSITRLARAYNMTIQSSGRTLSGGLDPAALHMPKKFFGAARNMREGGSLTILATALVETGSRMDDVVFEEFKGTGNMELMLNRKLSEKRIFPAIDLAKSGTRRDDLLLSEEEQRANEVIRKALNGPKAEDALEQLLDMFKHTKNNFELCGTAVKTRW